MRLDRIAYTALVLLSVFPATAQKPTEPVAEVANVRFYSDQLINLHHTLYAAAWAGRAQRSLAQKLPHPLTAPFTPEERTAWEQAVSYYDAQIASRDLLSGRGMIDIKQALVEGRLDDPAIDKELRTTLEAARPVFERYFWPEEDRANRAWITAVSERLKTIGPDVIPKLEKAYGTKWFPMPVRVDAVWVGSWAGGYTTINPTHATISSTDKVSQEWSGAEVVFHELSHGLVEGLSVKLRMQLGDSAAQHDALWHAILFYLTGAVVRDVLASRKVEYHPMVYALGLFDTSWKTYRTPIEETWGPYLAGRYSMDEAITRTVKALAAPAPQ